MHSAQQPSHEIAALDPSTAGCEGSGHAVGLTAWHAGWALHSLGARGNRGKVKPSAHIWRRGEKVLA